MRKSSYLLILSLSSHPALSADSRDYCSYKLQKSSEHKISDTEVFILYFKTLVEARILSQSEIHQFQSKLEEGVLSNPVTHKGTKHYSVHHPGFQKLIQNRKLDLLVLKNWLKEYLRQKSTVKKQKDETAKQTKNVKHITTQGAVFYLEQHPKLGEVYKILKPGKHAGDKDAFDEILWAVAPLKQEYSHLDPQDQGLNRRNSPAELACIRAGGRLPTDVEYRRLITYFKNLAPLDNDSISEEGLKDYKKIFPVVRGNRYWASSDKTKNINRQPRMQWTFSASTGMLIFMKSDYEFLVRCVISGD